MSAKSNVQPVQVHSYLSFQGTKLSSIVKNFTDKAVTAVYEEYSPMPEQDARILALYGEAVEACRKWLKAVLASEVMRNTDECGVYAQAVLQLPDRQLKVAVSDVDVENQSISGARHFELIKTPIGDIDYYTYNTILSMPDNPIQTLYRCFGKLLHQIHELCTLSVFDKTQDCVLNEDFLKEHMVRDVLNIYKFDTMWCKIDNFFNTIS